MDRQFRVGVIGCGSISNQYLPNLKKWDILDLVACADLNMEMAHAQAEKHGVPTACTVETMLADPEIDIVVNLTYPKAHAPVALQAIAAGKHVYNEKPLAMDPAEGQSILDAAAKAGVRVSGAPDTFLGAGIQTARKMIEDGAIGRPVAATAFLMSKGHESWHPNPEFYYEPGGGPMFDMGPYYLTALINLLGPIEQVSGTASVAITPRTITSQPKAGKKIDVETPDHVAGNLRFASGAVGTIITTFAAQHNILPRITIYGTEGTLAVPDPNGFDGEVSLAKAGEKEFTTVPHTHTLGYGRAVGVAEMAHAIAANRPHRASGQLAQSVLEAMQAFLDSSEQGRTISLQCKTDQPAILPTGLSKGILD